MAKKPMTPQQLSELARETYEKAHKLQRDVEATHARVEAAHERVTAAHRRAIALHKKATRDRGRSL